MHRKEFFLSWAYLDQLWCLALFSTVHTVKLAAKYKVKGNVSSLLASHYSLDFCMENVLKTFF